jgi:hypothetical protein
MAQLSIAGIYENGRIELGEKPRGVTKANVMVTFLEEETVSTDTHREDLRQRFLARLARGVDFGTDPLPTREEIYADRLTKF